MKRWKGNARRVASLLALGLVGSLIGNVFVPAIVRAQELDLDVPKPRPKLAHPANGQTVGSASKQGGMTGASSPNAIMPSMAKPLSVTVTKTLYLPPEMYGQWSIVGTLVQTNAPDFFNPTVNDIWILQREDDSVTVTNPANGASATISVDKVEGNRATFHREGPAGRNKIFQEVPTISVDGDRMTGQSINKIRYLKDGFVSREIFALYNLQATRISAGRVQFKPEESSQGPDIEIEPVQRR